MKTKDEGSKVEIGIRCVECGFPTEFEKDLMLKFETKGFSDALKEVEKEIDGIDESEYFSAEIYRKEAKSYVREIKQKISELNHGRSGLEDSSSSLAQAHSRVKPSDNSRQDGKDVAYSDLSETRLSADTNNKKLRGGE